MNRYDAVLLVSFGGPEGNDDVLPFLENVLRGRNVPRERMLAVAEHYYHFDGKSPINDQNRELIAALRREFAGAGIALPIYWGNRNWHPYLVDTIREMYRDGVRRAVSVVTSAFGSYSACRQYRENILHALEQADAPDLVIEKLNHYAASPVFAQCVADRVRDAVGGGAAAQEGHLVFTAHSIPTSMAASSPYVQQLESVSAQVASLTGFANWRLVYQSRSGPPSQPWLEPDVVDYLRQLASQGVRKVVLCPVGFLSDHMEVMYDLDTEAAAACRELGMEMVRAGTVGTHPRFVQLLREMIEAGEASPVASRCLPACCPAPAARP